MRIGQWLLLVVALGGAAPQITAAQDRQLNLQTHVAEGEVGLMRVAAAIRMIEREGWTRFRFNNSAAGSLDSLRALPADDVLEVGKPALRCDERSPGCVPVVLRVRSCEGLPPDLTSAVREFAFYCHARRAEPGATPPAPQRALALTCASADSLLGPITRAQRAVDVGTDYGPDGRLQSIATGREVATRTGIILTATLPFWDGETLPRLNLNVNVPREVIERAPVRGDSVDLVLDDRTIPLGRAAIPDIRSARPLANRPYLPPLSYDDLLQLAAASRASLQFRGESRRLQRDDLNAMNAIARRLICLGAPPP